LLAPFARAGKSLPVNLQHLERQKRGKLVSFLFAMFGASELIIALVRNGIWNEASGRNPALVESMQLRSPIIVLLFFGLLLNFYFSTGYIYRYHKSDLIFGSISFFLFLVLTEIALSPPVSAYISWTTILDGVLPGEILGLIHALFIGFANAKEEW
jgi:hypothetical protein